MNLLKIIKTNYVNFFEFDSFLFIYKGYSLRHNKLSLEDLYFLNADGQLSEYSEIFNREENFSKDLIKFRSGDWIGKLMKKNNA